jgi:hypothetical protein
MFATNEKLIKSARTILWGRRNLRWLIGGSGSGKTTLSRTVAARTGIPVYDMDEAFFGRFRFDPARHPATTAWFAAENPLDWMLSLSWEAFDALYRASNAEMLDLLAADLAGQPDEPLLIDGGVTHPSVLVGAVPAGRVICLEREEVARARVWDSAANRAEMKAAVLALPDGEVLWPRFLEYDRRMTATIGRESCEAEIRVFSWDETINIESLMGFLWDHPGT